VDLILSVGAVGVGAHGVGADAGPGTAHHRGDVLFAHGEVDSADAASRLGDEIKREVERVLICARRQEGDRTALRLRTCAADADLNIVPGRTGAHVGPFGMRGAEFADDTPTLCGITQARGRLLLGAAQCPAGQDLDAERRHKRRIRILIELHIHSARSCRLDHLQGSRDLAPVGAVLSLVMRELQGQTGAFGDIERLLHRFDQRIALIAQMGRVEAAVFRDNGAEFRQFVFVGIGGRRIFEAGGESPDARLQRRFQLPPHLHHVVGGRRPLLHPHDTFSQGAVAGKRDKMGGETAGLDLTQKLVVGLPADPRTVRGEPAFFEGEVRAVGGEAQREPAVTDDLRGDTHRQSAGLAGVPTDGDVGVRMDIDEAGREMQARGVEANAGLRLRQIADGRDPVAANPDIGADSWCARPIQHQAACQERIKTYLCSGLFRHKCLLNLLHFPRHYSAW